MEKVSERAQWLLWKLVELMFRLGEVVLRAMLLGFALLTVMFLASVAMRLLAWAFHYQLV